MVFTYSFCLILFISFPFSCLLLKLFFIIPLSLLFRNNILVFITLTNSSEITMRVSNLLKFILFCVFFFLLPPKYKDIKKYNSRWDRNIFLAPSAVGAHLILSPSYCPFGSSKIFYQFHAMAMHPLCCSHDFPERPQWGL